MKKTKISEAFPEPGARMTFLFDYGDERRFLVEMIGDGRKQAGERYPKLLKSVGAAPEQYPALDEGEED